MPHHESGSMHHHYSIHCIKASSVLEHPLGTELLPRVLDFPDQKETRYACPIPSAEQELVYKKKSGEKSTGQGDPVSCKRDRCCERFGMPRCQVHHQ